MDNEIKGIWLNRQQPDWVLYYVEGPTHNKGERHLRMLQDTPLGRILMERLGDANNWKRDAEDMER